MGFNPIGLRAAVEMWGVDRVVFGSDYHLLKTPRTSNDRSGGDLTLS